MDRGSFSLVCPCGLQLIRSCQTRGRVVSEEIIFIKILPNSSWSCSLAFGVCDPGSVNQRICLPLIRVREAVRPTLTLLSSLPSYPRPFSLSVPGLYFYLLLPVMVSI